MPTNPSKLLDDNALRAIRDYIKDHYQPLNTSLTAIAALTATSGFLKRTGSTTWALSSLAASDIPSLDASKITSGTFADARISSAATWNAKTKVTLNGTAVTTATIYAPTTSGTAGQVLQSNGANLAPTWVTPVGGGSVSSVALSMPTGFTVSGSPITSIGTLTVSLASGYQLMNDSAAQTFAGYKTFSSQTTFDGGIRIYDEDQDEYITMYGDADELWTNLGRIVTDGQIFYRHGTCSTDSLTASKTVTLINSSRFELKLGVRISVYFRTGSIVNIGNSDPITLNVQGTGAKPIYRYASSTGDIISDNTPTPYKLIRSGDVLHLIYSYIDSIGYVWLVEAVDKRYKEDILYTSETSNPTTGNKTLTLYNTELVSITTLIGRDTYMHLDRMDYDLIAFRARVSSGTTGNVGHDVYYMTPDDLIKRVSSTDAVYVNMNASGSAHTMYLIFNPATSDLMSDRINILSTSGMYYPFEVVGIRFGRRKD